MKSILSSSSKKGVFNASAWDCDVSCKSNSVCCFGYRRLPGRCPLHRLRSVGRLPEIGFESVGGELFSQPGTVQHEAAFVVDEGYSEDSLVRLPAAAEYDLTPASRRLV